MKLIAAVIALLATSSFAYAQGSPVFDCSKFKRSSDGSWSVLAPVTITGPDGSVEVGPGIAINHDEKYVGVDLEARLIAQCK